MQKSKTSKKFFKFFLHRTILNDPRANPRNRCMENLLKKIFPHFLIPYSPKHFLETLVDQESYSIYRLHLHSATSDDMYRWGIFFGKNDRIWRKVTLREKRHTSKDWCEKKKIDIFHEWPKFLTLRQMLTLFCFSPIVSPTNYTRNIYQKNIEQVLEKRGSFNYVCKGDETGTFILTLTIFGIQYSYPYPLSCMHACQFYTHTWHFSLTKNKRQKKYEIESRK